MILAVANLARSAQPVELDLSAFAGLVPVEMLGRTPFPRIGTIPYFLTLGPHAFYWFRLQKSAEDVAAFRAPVPTEAVEHVPTVEVAGDGTAVFDGPARERLERDALPGYLRSQRWFGGKARQIESVRIIDHGELGVSRALASLLSVRFRDGTSDLYFLPVAVTPGPLTDALRPDAIARLVGPAGESVLHDALTDPAVGTALLDAIAAGREFSTRGGTVRAAPTAAFAALRGDPDRPLPVVRGPATSSNSLVVFGRRLLLKVFRRLEVGVNPDVEIGRFLTDDSPFDRVPAMAGSVEYHRPGDGPVTLAILQVLVPNQGDGWRHTIDELGRYYERASGRADGPDPLRPDPRPLLELSESVPPPAVLEAIGSYRHAVATLGRRTAELHLALARGAADPAFAPRPITVADLDALRDDIVKEGTLALGLLRDAAGRLPESVAAAAQRLLEEGPAALDRLRRRPLPGAGAAKTRVHGDYHLGQVLWVENDWVILDFEGEPAKSVAARRAKQSPLKDVAGMLRSYHYAAYAGLFAFAQDRPADVARLAPWAEAWRQWVSAAFLTAYRGTIGPSPPVAVVPPDLPAFAGLLDAFMLDKALYELAYELNNRPDWVRIPLGGVLDLIAANPP